MIKKLSVIAPVKRMVDARLYIEPAYLRLTAMFNDIEFRRVRQIRKNCGCLNDVLTTTLMEVVSVDSSKTVSSFCFSGDIRVMDINSEGRLVLVKERHYVGTFPEVGDRYKRVLSARQVEVPRRRQLQISDAVGLKQRRS